MSKKLLLIVNPTAGKRKATEYLPQIVGKLEKADFEVQTRYTEIDKNATVVTREYGKGNDYIVCVGGDGTLKETICGVMELDLDCKIGYIPLGTTNDFAHSLHIPTDALKAVDVIIDGDEMKVDIGISTVKSSLSMFLALVISAMFLIKQNRALKIKLAVVLIIGKQLKKFTKLKGLKQKSNVTMAKL